MRIPGLLIIIAALFVLCPRCTDIYEQEKYQKPDWLTGKVYTQLVAQENLGKFAECLRITGMDTILDVSGSFTVFAPSDEAMDQFLTENSYPDVSAIPRGELERVVKFHILQNAWSKDQLQKLDVDGWINPADPQSEPKAYKRQTLLKNPNEKYWIQKRKDEDVIILDSTKAVRYKKVFTRSRKYAPIFYDEFFDIYNLSSEDYRFYFNRDYEPGNIYYASAKVIQPEIFAENGFIHVVDRVVNPMLNAKELLERVRPGESYQTFLKLIYQFPEFNSNLEETFDQPEARTGGFFDTLYNLRFPLLPFDIHEELTGPSTSVSKYTYVFHNGMYVPTDDAFQSFLDEVVTSKSGYPHWNSFDDMPSRVKQLIVQSHFTTSPVYPTNIQEGFEDGKGNIIYLDEADIISKEFGSNCTFLGLSSTVVPRAFSSITGPVYLRPGFSLLLYAIEDAKVLNALTRIGREYSFFAIPDAAMAEDSSLLIQWIDEELERYRFRTYDRGQLQMISMPTSTLGKRILNQVGISIPTGSADKEFIETLGGKLIIWNNLDNTVQGSGNNVFGYHGDSLIVVNPVPLEEPVDNGKTYTVNSWFTNTSNDMYATITRYRYWRDLMQRVGLYNIKTFGFPFLTEGEFYTIFIPSQQSLNNYQVDTLTNQELEAFIRYHFVRGDRIYTDNKKLPGNYETLRKDESSTSYITRYSTLNIRPGRDVIDILDSEGDLVTSIQEQPGRSNVVVYYDTDKSSESTSEYDLIITAVLHEIDTLLIKQ